MRHSDAATLNEKLRRKASNAEPTVIICRTRRQIVETLDEPNAIRAACQQMKSAAGSRALGSLQRGTGLRPSSTHHRHPRLRCHGARSEAQPLLVFPGALARI